MHDFTTERLEVRDWTPILGDPFARIALAETLGDILTPPVMRHLPERVQLSPDDPDLSHWIEARAAAGDVYTASMRSGGALVGLFFLSDPVPTAAGEDRFLGYLLAEESWGRGFASELVSGAVAALEGYGPLRLVAGVETGNTASSRVLLKAGFVHDPALSEPGLNKYTRVPG